jgi:hypothetical protein
MNFRLTRLSICNRKPEETLAQSRASRYKPHTAAEQRARSQSLHSIYTGPQVKYDKGKLISCLT